MWGYRAVELPGGSYGIELDSNIVMVGIDTWENAERFADQLNMAYQHALDHIKAS